MQMPSYIVSVFQQAGLCTGSFDPRQVAAQVQSYLEELGMNLESWEPVSQAACFAVLVTARAKTGQRIDLLEVRRQLTTRLSALELQVRIQREDVFLAMHRL